MNDIISEFYSFDAMNVVSIVVGAISVFIAVNLFFRKKHADKNLAELFKSDSAFYKIYIDEINKVKSFNDTTIKKFQNKIDLNSDYDIKSLEVKKKMLEREIELVKLILIKEKISELSNKLSNNEKHEVLEALNQNTVVGQKTYINNILKQSGSLENIALELEK